MTTCNNCGSETTAKFCAECGQEAKFKRIDAHYISHEIQHLLHLEKGFLYTAKELLGRPGDTIKAYINGIRNKHVKPVPFLIVTSLIYTLISHYFHFENNYEREPSLHQSAVAILLNWMQTHYGYANIAMGGLIALWIQLFFRKQQYNIYEITVLLCFVMGQGMLFLTVVVIFGGLLKNFFIVQIMSYVIWLYISWAIGQFYNKRKVSSYIKAFLAYGLGTVSFYVILIGAGIVYDAVIR